mmetsp:Transcript_7418/g.15479  ORF Transcript_7418/g.15479 Transcript_7418/m.15479 type:complete len:136 (-) Transcript_7418:293-700(-)|eukprot:CAMPEP_0172444720 /NCGR_PEP_ID=MMETSP1065-20121228/4732_1 /TAXON_ID=265537 /ORGANISM="Amphiprora paludosa, Strain CCMP125" /LENGTH=135 /DNA_ID=CAMNT_0013195373 /DNA_START=270 /DNA_END=677 /DNA_ORIENTATION=+
MARRSLISFCITIVVALSLLAESHAWVATPPHGTRAATSSLALHPHQAAELAELARHHNLLAQQQEQTDGIKSLAVAAGAANQRRRIPVLGWCWQLIARRNRSDPQECEAEFLEGQAPVSIMPPTDSATHDPLLP